MSGSSQRHPKIPLTSCPRIDAPRKPSCHHSKANGYPTMATHAGQRCKFITLPPRTASRSPRESLDPGSLVPPRGFSPVWLACFCRWAGGWISTPDATCTVYRMSRGRVHERSLGLSDEIPTLFQGANYDRSGSQRVLIYPGDSEIHDPEELSMQIHTLKLEKDGVVVAENVPAIAVWVPRAMGRAWISQHQS